MKAFHFQLDPALRWRSTQLRLERESVSRAAGHLSALQTDLNTAHIELRAGAADLVSTGSVVFASWATYVDRCRRRIRTLEEQSREAKQSLALQTRKMVQAHQKVQVLENLKRDGQAGWVRELSRETETLAGEAFLASLLRKARVTDTDDLRARIEKRTGA
jgi:hypothetical protein